MHSPSSCKNPCKSGPHARCANEHSTKFSTLCSPSSSEEDRPSSASEDIPSITPKASAKEPKLQAHHSHSPQLAHSRLPSRASAHAVVGFFQMDCRLCRSEFVIGAAACENLRESPTPVVMIASGCLESMGRSEGLRAKFTVRPCFLLSVCVYLFPFSCDCKPGTSLCHACVVLLTFLPVVV